jgi:hypothetical protein
MSDWKRVLSAMLLVTALFGYGCDDEGGVCGDLTDSCTTEGDTRCGADGVETCGDAGGGCFLWTLTAACGPSQDCEASGGGHECACSDECEGSGAAACDGDAIVRCLADGDGCLVNVDVIDCAASGQTCDDTGDEPFCSDEACADECDDAGAVACDGDELTTCVEGDDGCLDLDVTDCAAFDASCDDSGAEPVCVLACADDCATVGETLCLGGVVAECVAGEGGCLDLELGEDCTDGGQVCDDSGAEAECVTVCENSCAAAGDSECDGDVVVTCVADADGCLSLEPATDCRDTLQTCEATGGDAACVGCGACDAPGEYCDDVADPPVCEVAGHVSEILTGVTEGTAWSALPEMTRRALEARAALTNSEYRALFGAEALADAVETMTTAPTAAELTNYGAFLSSMFGVDAVANAELDALLRQLYVLFLFSHQGMVINYQYLPAFTWDGVTPITWFPSPEPESQAAYRALGTEITAVFQALRHDPANGLTTEERRVLESATAVARGLRSGSLGYHFGDRMLSQVHSLLGWGWDFMLNYHEWGGAIFVDDDAFLDQLNAYYFADLIRVNEGTVPALEFQYSGAFDVFYIEMLIGPTAESRTAQLYQLIGSFFRDRVLAHPDIGRECHPYTADELASIWDAFTADRGTDNDGLTTLASFEGQSSSLAAAWVEIYKAQLADALYAVFPSPTAAMSLAERDAIVAAVDAAGTLGEVMAAFDDGLAAAGDGTAPAVFDAEIAGLTYVFGRDYADATSGATWLAEDTATAQAMWDEVRAWILATYDIDPASLPVDLIVTTETGQYPMASDLYWGLGTRFSLTTAYGQLFFIGSQAISNAAGSSWSGSVAIGFGSATYTMRIADRFLAVTLPPAELANLPLYGVEGRSMWMVRWGERDAALRQFLDGCGHGGIVGWLRDDVLGGWGVAEEDRDRVIGYVTLGPWLLQYSYSEITYSDLFTALQERLDADYGPGTYLVDPFVLQACGIYDPHVDDVTYGALVDCVTP